MIIVWFLVIIVALQWFALRMYEGVPPKDLGNGFYRGLFFGVCVAQAIYMVTVLYLASTNQL